MTVDLKAKYNAFPSDFESLEEKKTERFGLEYVKAMYSLHALNYPINNPTMLQYFMNREWAEGIYSTNIYKPRMGMEGDTSFLNLDYSAICRIPTIVDNMVGKLTNKPWRFQCNPTDTVSRSKFDDARDEMRADMFLKQHSDEVEKRTGIPLIPKGKFVPEDEDEKELHLQMNFKLDEAEAMELALKWVFDNNNFEKESVPKIYRDLIVDKKTAIWRYYDENKNIRVKRWDHIKLIHPNSVEEDFKDIPYVGLLQTYTIGALAKMNAGLTDEQLYTIAKCHAGKNNNLPWNSDWYLNYQAYSGRYGEIAYQQFQNFNIDLVNFYFLTPVNTVKAVKTNVSGRVRVEDKKGDYVADTKEKTFGEQTEDVDVVRRKKLVRFEGFWVPGTDIIWDYKMSENVERDPTPGGYSPETELPVKIIMPNMIGNKNKSDVQRMIPIEKQVMLAWLKLQQFLIEAMPPGMAINQNALLEVVNGAGEGKALPTDWTKLYKQTGNIIFTDKGPDGLPINIPFKELNGGIGPAFMDFMRVMDYGINKMNEVVGYNTAVDASSPKTDVLVGTQEMAQQATYDCMRPKYMAATNLIEGTGKRVGLMIQDCLRLGNDSFRLALAEAIGQSNVDVLTMGRDVPFSSAAISVEIQPDDFEMQAINRHIELGIANKTLTSSDALRVRQQLKTNVKLAGQLMVFLEKKNIKEAIKLQSAAIQENAVAQQQSAQVASQMKQQELQLENQAKKELMQFEYQLKGGLSEQEHLQNMQEIAGKNSGLIQQAQVNAGRAIQVQEISTTGKLEEAHIAKEGAIEKSHIDHEGKLKHEAFKAAVTPKKEPAKK
ncbi:MAG: hypothetical protein V4549_07355 [Bacteroidota bacterium]